MKQDRSFGAVVYRKEGSALFYLLLNYESGYWDFPKGHAEPGEQPLTAMRREVTEETGLKKVHIADGFEEHTHYFFRRAGQLIAKDATFYLAYTTEKKITISPEHLDARWATYEDALKLMKFKNSKEVLTKAHQYLQKSASFQMTLHDHKL